jgi:predicted negative regulator of RcsB-dependent stress response
VPDRLTAYCGETWQDCAAVSDWVSAASVGLGDLLRGLGDHEGARRAFQRAIDSGDPTWAPVAVQAIRDVEDGNKGTKR